MSLLLGSGGVGTEGRRLTYRNLMTENFSGCERVAFIPYASTDHDAYSKRMRDFAGGEIDLIGIHQFDDPASELENFDGVYVGGGNTWLLVRELHERGLIDPIRKSVMTEGKPYAGVSAGANVACPTMQTTNDMPITMVPSFETLGLVPFQINPHYYPGGIWFRESEEGDFSKHFGESRARRISEFHEMNEYPVIGLYEGSYLMSENDCYRLIGNKAALIRKGHDLTTVEAGTILTEKLTPT